VNVAARLLADQNVPGAVVGFIIFLRPYIEMLGKSWVTDVLYYGLHALWVCFALAVFLGPVLEGFVSFFRD